jgi:hypothetical protein
MLFAARKAARALQAAITALGADAATGVFTTVRHWLTPSTHTCFVAQGWMTVHAVDTDKDFRWRGHAESTCRFRNAGWPEGAEALRAWAESWDARIDTPVSVRQFLLFESVG